MRPLPAPGHQNKLGPACVRQGSSVASCGRRTKIESAHRTVFRVLVYPWHPWFGMRVAIHEVLDKADGAVFRGTLSGSRSDRGLEVPAWMFDRSCCPDRAHLTEAPFVSAGALGALSAVLDMASKALRASSNPLLFGASNLPHDQNRGECDATEDSDAVPRMSAGFASDTPRKGLVRGQPQCINEDMASRAGESHPHALLDPYVSLSAHTAPDVRSLTYKRRQWANRSGSARTTRANQSLAPAVRARSRLYLLRPYRTR
jgi:hypothetical protein